MRSRYHLPGSMFLVFTGPVNCGKTWQMQWMLQAKLADGSLAVQPCLFIFAEASSEGTAGDLLSSPGVLAWGVQTLDDAVQALALCFPAGHPPLTLAAARKAHAKWVADRGGSPPEPVSSPMDNLPLASIAVDSVTQLYSGQKAWIRERAIEARPGDRTAVKKTAANLEQDEKRIAGFAYAAATAMVDALSGISLRHRGILILVACHTTAAKQSYLVGEGPRAEMKEQVIGEVPDFGSAGTLAQGIQVPAYSKIWTTLAAKATTIVHVYSTAQDYTRMAPADINSDAKPAVMFGAVTMRGIYPGLGPVMWAKRQGGDWFDVLPRLWHPAVPWTNSDGEDMHNALAGQFLQHCPSGGRYTQHAENSPGRAPDFGLVLELIINAPK